MQTRCLSSFLSILLLTVPIVSYAGGTEYTSVQNGPWGAGATWDLGVPPGQDIGDQASVQHVVTLGLPGQTANVITIGETAGSSGTLLVGGGDLTVRSVVVVGTTTGVPGTLEIQGNAGTLDSGDRFWLEPSGTLKLRPTANGAAGLSTISTVDLQYFAGGTIELDTSLYSPNVGDSWEIINYSGGLVGSATNLSAPAGFTFVEDQSAPGVIRIRVTSVPIEFEIPISLTGEILHQEDLGGDRPAQASRLFFSDRLESVASAFTVDLGTLSSMTALLEAPPGKRFLVAPPAGVSNIILAVVFEYSASGSFGQTEQWPHTISFLDLEGEAPTLTFSRTSGRVQGIELDILARWDVTGTFSFSGIDFQVSGPFSSGGLATYTESGGTVQFFYESPTDPGPIVGLSDILPVRSASWGAVKRLFDE